MIKTVIDGWVDVQIPNYQSAIDGFKNVLEENKHLDQKATILKNKIKNILDSSSEDTSKVKNIEQVIVEES